ncbi:MAG: adenosylmethionine decarboxylase [Candidatus Parvarchaeum sp.]
MVVVGHHAILDFHGVSVGVLNYVEPLRTVMRKVAEEAKMHILAEDYHQFSPVGASGIILVEESHIAYHSYPESNLLTVDIYSCGDYEAFMNGVNYLIKILDGDVEMHILKRGEEFNE